MRLWRKKSDDLRVDTFTEIEPDERPGKKNKERARKEKEREREREKERRDSNPELAARLREYGENYGLEEDPYLEGLSNAIEEGKNLAVWASNDVMTLMPHPDVESVEGPIYSAMVLIRNVLVFVPVALTWLAVGKATTGFSVYTAKSSAASVVNFLQFWQNGYGVLAKMWTLSHIAEDDFYIIGTVIILTFITPFMNRSAVKKAARFEQDALRERLVLVIEVESFLFDKRRLTPLSIDSALAQSFERIVEATHNLMVASKRIELGLQSLPRQIENANPGRYVVDDDESDCEEPKPIPRKSRKQEEPQDTQELPRELLITQQTPPPVVEPIFEKRESESVEHAAETLDAVVKRVDVIVQSLPRRAHARKELKKVEVELDQTRTELMLLQNKLKKKQKKAQKQNEWKAAKREAERNKAIGNSKRNGPVAAGAPSFIEIE